MPAAERFQAAILIKEASDCSLEHTPDTSEQQQQARFLKTHDIYPSPLKFCGCCQGGSSSSHMKNYAPGTHHLDAYPAPSNPMGI